MPISTNREQLEKDKFVDDGSGNAAVRIIIASDDSVAQGADVASAANLTIVRPATAFEVTGTTNIDFITTDGSSNGHIITLIFAGILDVNHNSGLIPGGSAAIITKTGAAVTTATGSVIRLQLLEQGGTQRWYEI